VLVKGGQFFMGRDVFRCVRGNSFWNICGTSVFSILLCNELER